jgi:hypothetical protein
MAEQIVRSDLEERGEQRIDAFIGWTPVLAAARASLADHHIRPWSQQHCR